MRKFIITCAVALAAFTGVSAAAPTQTEKSVTIQAATPGVIAKTLKVTGLDENDARLTIETANGRRESVVVLGGDVRAALYVAGIAGGNCPTH